MKIAEIVLVIEANEDEKPVLTDEETDLVETIAGTDVIVITIEDGNVVTVVVTLNQEEDLIVVNAVPARSVTLVAVTDERMNETSSSNNSNLSLEIVPLLHPIDEVDEIEEIALPIVESSSSSSAAEAVQTDQ